MNVTGPETVSVRYAAQRLGGLLGKTPVFEGEEQNNAYLNNAGRAAELVGYPSGAVNTLIEWQAQWLLDGKTGINKPTHFEERKGSY